MDRYRCSWLEQAECLGSPLWVEMARRQSWPPACDGKQREVERCELRHGREQIGVPGEVDALRPRDQVTERGRADAERPSAGVVLRLGGRHRHLADLDFLCDVDLDDVRKPAASHDPSRAARQYDPDASSYLHEGTNVEMIPVRVRDEHRVHLPERLGGDGSVAAQVQHAPAQHGIGQQSDAVELQQDCCVTDVGDARHLCSNLKARLEPCPHSTRWVVTSSTRWRTSTSRAT